jgi:hypothetical protein
MNRQHNFNPGEMETEALAIVDLADANVSPLANAGAWEAEIAARQHGEREKPPQPFNETLDKVIEFSTALA